MPCPQGHPSFAKAAFDIARVYPVQSVISPDSDRQQIIPPGRLARRSRKPMAATPSTNMSRTGEILSELIPATSRFQISARVLENAAARWAQDERHGQCDAQCRRHDQQAVDT